MANRSTPGLFVEGRSQTLLWRCMPKNNNEIPCQGGRVCSLAESCWLKKKKLVDPSELRYPPAYGHPPEEEFPPPRSEPHKKNKQGKGKAWPRSAGVGAGTRTNSGKQPTCETGNADGGGRATPWGQGERRGRHRGRTCMPAAPVSDLDAMAMAFTATLTLGAPTTWTCS